MPSLTETGGVPPYIYGDIGGTDRWVWFVLANLLALAAVCPFVGALSDLLGRRYVAMMGSLLIVVGSIVCATAKVMNTFIGTFGFRLPRFCCLHCYICLNPTLSSQRMLDKAGAFSPSLDLEGAIVLCQSSLAYFEYISGISFL